MLGLFWFSLPFQQIMARDYEGGLAAIMAWTIGLVSFLIAAMHYGCYRYAKHNRLHRLVLGCMGCFVFLTDIPGLALAGRILWIYSKGLLSE